MTSSFHQMLFQPNKSISRMTSFPKAFKAPAKYDRLSPIRNNDYRLSSFLNTSARQSTDYINWQPNHSAFLQSEAKADLKRELTAFQEDFKSEIRLLMQSMISNKELTDKTIEDRLNAISREIKDMKEEMNRLDSADDFNQKAKGRNNCFNPMKTEESEEHVYMNTMRSQAIVFPDEKQSEMNYRINRNNQNLKALNQNMKTLMTHIKTNAASVEEIQLELKRTNASLAQMKEESNDRLAKVADDIETLKQQFDSIALSLSQAKRQLANGLEAFDAFHQEQNKLNDIYALTSKELFAELNKEKIENEKNNQMVEDNFNLITPLLDKVKNMPDLEQDIPFLAELRKSMKENSHCCWSHLNRFDDLSQSHENFDLKFNKTNREKSLVEVTQTDLLTGNTFMEDSVVTSSPSVHHQMVPLFVDNMALRYRDQCNYSLCIKYYQSGYITSDKGRCDLAVRKSGDTPLGNSNEEFNLDKTSGKMKRKNRKVVSMKNTIVIDARREQEKAAWRSERKKRIIALILKNELIKSKNVFEVDYTL